MNQIRRLLVTFWKRKGKNPQKSTFSYVRCAYVRPCVRNLSAIKKICWAPPSDLGQNKMLGSLHCQKIGGFEKSSLTENSLFSFSSPSLPSLPSSPASESSLPSLAMGFFSWPSLVTYFHQTAQHIPCLHRLWAFSLEMRQNQGRHLVALLVLPLLLRLRLPLHLRHHPLRLDLLHHPQELLLRGCEPEPLGCEPEPRHLAPGINGCSHLMYTCRISLPIVAMASVGGDVCSRCVLNLA